MLSIGKLGQGQERYYLEAVAEGAEDYYVYAGEAPGRWIGGGSQSLALAGEVDGEDFTSVLRAVDPATGAPLGRQHAASKVPGFDLTFSAPKSVSLLFALGDAELSARMRDAHDAAVADALGYLERTASHGRRGHAGAQRITTTGFLAAAFRHRTSRAGDPNVHTHVVIGNRVLGSDGRWSALDAKAVYAQAKTAGTLYESSLRHELRDLGLSWTVAPTGLAEIDGVPHAVRRAFSQRRQQIEEHLAERGLSGARAAQVATMQTREKKEYGVDADTLVGQWRERAAALGFTDRTIADLLTEGRERVARTAPEIIPVAGRLLGPDGLTERASTFGQREVLRAVANALPDGASVAQVEDLAEQLLAAPGVVPLAAPEWLRGQDVLRVRRGGARLVPFGASERRFSTAELLALEQDLIRTALSAQGTGAVRADVSAVAESLARRPALNEEQIEMVRRLTMSGDGVSVVNAAAGSGKTTALDAVTEAFTRSGRAVVGATLSAKAAGVLHDETGMPTFTITRLLLDLRDPRSEGLPVGCVLVVDEAGQVGTRALAEIQSHVQRAGGKLVLVGDLHQLPEIDAGGAFRGLARRLEAVELEANHRQQEPAEQERLRELRSGDVRAAMRSYDEAGRITRASTSEDLREGLVTDWTAAYLASGSGGSVVMLGLTNHDVDDLNVRAREHLVRADRLGEDEVIVGRRGYRVGDQVVTRQNDYRLGVLNGQRWTVTGVDVRGRELVLQRDAVDGLLRLPFAYAEAGTERLQHAYALTTALAQGSTVDQAFVLGSDATYREAGYTAASRARQRTQFYVVSRDADEACEERHGRLHVEAAEQDPLDEVTKALSRSAAQHLATDTRPVMEAEYVDVLPTPQEARRRDRDLIRARLRDAPQDLRQELARLDRELAGAYASHDRAAGDRLAFEEKLHFGTDRRRRRSSSAAEIDGRLEVLKIAEAQWSLRVDELAHERALVKHRGLAYERWHESSDVKPARHELLDRPLPADGPERRLADFEQVEIPDLAL